MAGAGGGTGSFVSSGEPYGRRFDPGVLDGTSQDMDSMLCGVQAFRGSQCVAAYSGREPAGSKALHARQLFPICHPFRPGAPDQQGGGQILHRQSGGGPGLICPDALSGAGDHLAGGEDAAKEYAVGVGDAQWGKMKQAAVPFPGANGFLLCERFINFLLAKWEYS